MLKNLDIIADALNESNWTVVSQQLQQLLDKKDVNSQTLEDNELEQAVTIAIQLIKAGDFQTKWDVAKIFPQIGKTAIFPLLEILEDEEADFEIRWFALRILGEFNEPQIVISLVKLLEETEEEELAIASAQALAKIGQPAITALVELLQSEKSRLLAVKSLAQIRRSEVIKPLLVVVNDSIAEVRVTAIEALSSFYDKCLIPVFITALQDTSAGVRKEAIIALKMRAEFNEEFQLVNHLQPLMYDSNTEVCQQAILALGCMKDTVAIEYLFNILTCNHTSLSLRQEAAYALNWSQTFLALDYLKESLYLHSFGLHAEIIAVLGRQESVELKSYSTQIIIDFLMSNQRIIRESQIKQVIATSLGELGDLAAITYLEELADDENSRVKLHAKSAIKSLHYQHQ